MFMKSVKKLFSNRWTKAIVLLALSGSCFYAGHALAAAPTLNEVSTNITGTFASLAKLITAVAYVAGLGFAMGAVLKFKQHKDNPTQVPIGAPVALLLVGAALMFLPSVFRIAGDTVFGSGAVSGSLSGTSTFS